MLTKTTSARLLLSLLAALTLAACGADIATDSDNNSAPSSGPGNQANATMLTGSVGDGPVQQARVRVYSRTGRLLASGQSDNATNYEIAMNPRDDDYPLTVTATGGLDVVSGSQPDFTMHSYVMRPGNRHTAHINPFTTMIYETAKTMNGGMNETNAQQAKTHVLEVMNFGYESDRMPDPASAAVNKDNIAGLLRASEAMGEMIRRVRDRSRILDTNQTGDTVMRALAADLSDGVIDGVGAGNTNSRTSALSKVASAQVILEVMQGSLQVNGNDATFALDNALQVSLPDETITRSTNDVGVNGTMLEQVKENLSAVIAVDPSNSLAETLDDINAIQAGTLPSVIDAVISDTVTDTIGDTLDAVSTAPVEDLDTVNNTTDEQSPSDPPAQNTAPVISGTALASVQAANGYSFVPVAADADGDILSFSVSNKPSWLSFDSSTGALTGTPTELQVGTYSGIQISVSDGTDAATLPAFTITVTEIPNTLPVISGSPATSVTEGNSYSFIPTAFDADADSLTFSITNRPAWASFNTSTGRLSGTPGSANVGTHSNIRIQVTDGTDTVSLPSFSITVLELPNASPVISGAPLTSIQAGAAYSFTPSAYDADGDTLQYSITNKPVWATFSAVTGRLSGTPTDTHAGTTSGIVISVSDGAAATSLASFSITVTAAPNNAPVISGAPATTVQEGSSYAFAPAANDADGNTLVFSITNKPVWATFNTTTGSLTGTPGSTHVGTTSGIVISVSDGKTSASLPAFAITVSAKVVTYGTATLSWLPPTERMDGSALTNLSGYTIYYGTASGQYTQSIRLNNPGLSSYVVENLPSGFTYYFAITALDASGLESSHSVEGSKRIQ